MYVYLLWHMFCYTIQQIKPFMVIGLRCNKLLEYTKQTSLKGKA